MSFTIFFIDKFQFLTVVDNKDQLSERNFVVILILDFMKINKFGGGRIVPIL